MKGMSGVWWREMSGEGWVVRDEWWEMSGERWVVGDECVCDVLYEMSETSSVRCLCMWYVCVRDEWVVRDGGERWAMWDGLRWVVWGEWCENGYPERRLHTARRQTRTPGRHQRKNFASHIGTATPNVLRPPHRQRPRPSGDTARRNPFGRLLVLRLPSARRGGPAATPRAASPLKALSTAPVTQTVAAAQRRHRAPQPLAKALRIAPATQTEAAAQRRHRAPQPLRKALSTAPAIRPTRRPSGDTARRNPFQRLWVLRLPSDRRGGPAATPRAATPSKGSEYCACHTDGSRGPAATPRAATPSEGSEYCACHTDGSRGGRGGRAATPSEDSEYCAWHTDGSCMYCMYLIPIGITGPDRTRPFYSRTGSQGGSP